ncbi:hypothetical protein C8J57DRAFT_521190 [Mycena rebaudengoi]|nr:hypothetical protein C8J57DRAFT_521190 [Mycena rebaudengoi]
MEGMGLCGTLWDSLCLWVALIYAWAARGRKSRRICLPKLLPEVYHKAVAGGVITAQAGNLTFLSVDLSEYPGPESFDEYSFFEAL